MNVDPLIYFFKRGKASKRT